MVHDNLTAAWRALEARGAETRAVSLRALRDGDPARGKRFAREAAGLYLDFSRQRIDDDGLHLLASLAEGGVLIYETFMLGNERYGRPSNPAFLLRPGELRESFAELRIEGYEEGPVATPKPAMIQRLCGTRARKG